MGHLEPGDATDFVQGRGAPARRADIERHLADCPDCQAMVLEVVRASTATVPQPASPAPVKVSRFVVLNVVGAGAMGTVFAAYDPRLDRRVALKLLSINEGHDALLAEARAMARVTHPNIVTVYEAGEADEQLYLVMDFVEGQTLRAWLASKPPTTAVLDVFLQAAAGLGAAHRGGVVHRDFKPENVLVDADGRARVADFGLALANERSETGQLVGTPAYLAPEVLRGAPATPASDQFSFAVALVEALTGQRPVEGQSLDALRAATEHPLKLPPGVPRHLRAPLARALSLAPADRFPSMAELASALAPRGSSRAFVIATVAVAAVVAAISATAVSRSRACSGAARALEAAWTSETREAVRTSLAATGRTFSATAAAKTVQHLDTWAEAWRAMSVEACVATRVDGAQSDALLTLRERCLARRLGDFTALARELSSATPEVAERAVSAALALPDVADCADTEALSLPAAPPPAAQAGAVEALTAEVARLQALLLSGRYPEGLAVAPDIVARTRALGWAPLEAEALQWLGLLQERSGQSKDGEATLRAAALAADRGHDDARRVQVLLDLAFLVGRAGARPADGRIQLDAAAAVIARLGGERAAETGRLRNIESALQVAEGQYDAAVASSAEALRLLRGATTPNDASLRSALNNAGVALWMAGKPDEALARFQESLERTVAVAGEDSPEVIPMLANLGGVHLATGRFTDAEKSLRAALTLSDEALGPEHAWSLRAANNLAIAVLGLGHLDDALALSRRAVAGRRKSAPPGVLAKSVTVLGSVLAARGEWREAEAAYREGLTLGQQANDASEMAHARLGLGRCALAAKDAARALMLFDEAPLSAMGGTADAEEVTSACVARAEALLALARPAEALALFEPTPCFTSASETIEARLAFAHARALAAVGQRDKSKALAQQALDAFRRAGDDWKRQRADVEAWLAH